MTVEQSDTIVLYALDSTASAAVLEQAAELETTVRIFADNELSVVLMEGALTKVTDQHLRIWATHKNTSSLAVNVLATLKAEFTLGKVTYAFDVLALDEFSDGDDQSMLIPKPPTIAVTERRRTRRRQFHDAADLTLKPIGCDSAAPIRAALLNISTDGLACRVTDSALQFIPADKPLAVSFALSANGHTFDLTGHEVSRTEAGTPGHWVVGLEFEKGRHMEQRTLLRQALRDSSESIQDNPL